MILADKIMDLRKRAGWSQEELAERLEVSRQSVSKWESAQSVPDMNRVLQLSALFGVSTDYLLKDELGPETQEGALLPEESDTRVRAVSMEEAAAFLSHREFAAGRISLGVALCILSPVVLFLLGGFQNAGRLPVSEGQALGVGMTVLLLMVGAAVALFITTGLRGSRFEYLSEEPIETSYGVDGMVRERRESYRGAFTARLVTGIVLCVISSIPLFLVVPIWEGRAGADNSVPGALALTALLLLAAAGVWLILRAAIVWGGFQALLEEGDYSREQKAEAKRNQNLAAVYWCSATALYLAWSFITGAWDRTWIVWPVAGVLYAAVVAVARSLRKKG